jgi:site-specific DNA recombinase
LGAHSAPNPDCYACTNHVLGNGRDNAGTVDRKALESRVLTRLRERMMTPENAAEAMRAYTQEANRLNRQRRGSMESTRHELAEAAKAHRGDRARHRATRLAPHPVRPADRA